jgi:phosphatidate cytidylyltransferase
VIASAAPIDVAYLILVAWLFGGALLTILSIFPATRSKLEGVWPLMVSEAAILFAGTVPWLLTQPFLGAALAAAASRVGYESGRVMGTSQPGAGILGASLLAILTLFAWFASYLNHDVGIAAWVAVLIALVIVASLRPSRGWFWRFLIFPVLPFILFVTAARWSEMASYFVLSLFIVEIFDSFALLGGRLFGKRPLAPSLSPRKTWEGLAVGLMAVVVAACAAKFALNMDVITVAAITTASTIGAIVGDLTASAAKRRVHVKDYPAVISSQGGLLDIYDSWIVAGPLSIGAVMLLMYLR